MTELQEAISALHHTDPSVDRPAWTKLVCSAKAAGIPRDIVEAWSASADNYTRSGFRDTWKSFSPSGGITEKTLFYLAGKEGYRSGRRIERPVPIPIRTPEPDPEPNDSYYRGMGFLRTAAPDNVTGHAYAMTKRIKHAFGALRGMCALSEKRVPQDCLLIPQKDWEDKVIGVEAIPPSGTKLTYGSKGHLILGHPEGAELIHVAEGWATCYALSQMFPRPFAAICVFGKHSLEKVARAAAERFSGNILIHEEHDNLDAWDLWDSGKGDAYVQQILRAV